ncbi:DUF2894 domain-containing protein [Pandoraea pulmonicola]|nr:DUF2894 domain-containing protein [Pandoraea pulmonicola]SUA91817.1 Protein of uncharacterised function (DUF2894) [Pandoraea pulmonicola]
MRDANVDSLVAEASVASGAPAPAAPADTLSARIAQWRSQGADKRDPVRFHRIEALAARSRAYDGDIRRVLDERLKTLVDEFAQRLTSIESTPETSQDAPTDQRAASLLAALAADISHRAGDRAAPAPASRAPRAPRAPRAVALASNTGRAGDTISPATAPASTSTLAPSAAPPARRAATPLTPVAVPITPTVISTDDAFEDLDVLEYFRETWSKLSTDGNLRQSLAQVPENAGPLNSSHLVHRALSLMHDVSPDYLRHFLRHADALSWLEDMETTGVLGNKSPARATTPAKPSRAKTR